jgi:hypothetical protein
MVMLDGTYDGGGDDLNEDLGHSEVDHSDDGDGYGFDYPQQEDYENDADNFESHQCALDMDCGDGDY